MNYLTDSSAPQIEASYPRHQKTTESLQTEIAQSVLTEVNKISRLTIPEKGFINSKLFVIIIAVSHGLFEIASLSTFFYQKNELQLEPQVIQMLAGLIGFPWCIKPIFGYIVDQLLRRFKKTKYIVLCTSMIRMLAFALIAHFNLGVFCFYVVCFVNGMCSLFENVISEYILVINTKRENELNGNRKGNQLPLFFGFRAVGSLVGLFLGGRVMKFYGIQSTFFICSMIPVATVFVALAYQERPILTPDGEQKDFRAEARAIKQLVLKDKVLMLVCFICLINMTPNFDMLVTFYLTDYLKFTTEDLANFSAFATVCYILGLIIYSLYLKNIEPKSFYIATNFLLWACHLSFLLVVLRVIEHWGIDDKVFCLLSRGATSFIAELNFMPILAIWCSICPENLEATSITLFTGLINLSSNMSNYFGSFLIWLMGIHNNNYDELWKPIVIQQLYLLTMMIGLIFIEFPDPSAKDEGENMMDSVASSMKSLNIED